MGVHGFAMFLEQQHVPARGVCVCVQLCTKEFHTISFKTQGRQAHQTYLPQRSYGMMGEG